MNIRYYATLFILINCTLSLFAEDWPKEIKTDKGATINIYQPQPESMKGNVLEGRAAFSVQMSKDSDLSFGVFWYTANMLTDRDARTVTLESIKVNGVKLPGAEDTTKIAKFRTLLETEIPKWQITASIADITSTIEEEQAYVSDELKNDPPEIEYASKSTTLVLIDGEPKLQDDKDLKMKRVVNSPFFIVENPDDKKFYLYGGQFWYVSSSVTEGYKPVSPLPKTIASLDEQIKKQQKEKSTEPVAATSPPAIIVKTKPTELIQSDGQADFASIPETGLLYMSNSENDIFRSISDSQYYVLISGRWYAAPKLEGPWKYVAADKLPKDFSKIPEGSPKDNVLASVAGTEQSQDAIRDAQVPQTAKVDRKKATCTVTYDGEPKFEKIEGTSLELAMNTSSTVLKAGSNYYCVEDGVWFASANAKGPWKVSDERPKDVDKIPASSSAYNVKYVYVYDSTPEVVYVGYTPGYMGCYVYGPTVVYGTGYYYSPWYGPHYYPRPYTYGFSMHYNPWTGWSMGFHFSAGWFSMGFYGGGGYWGPPIYRPPFYPPYRGGMYGGRGPTYINGDVNINVDRSNNIYNRRNDVSTNDVRRDNRSSQPGVSTRDQTRRASQPGVSTRDQTRNQTRQQPAATNPKNKGDVYSDRNGNVYQRNDNGNWNQRDGNQWKQTQQTQQMNRDYENRQRSVQQNNNFNQMNRGGNMGGSYRGGGGGGMRRR